MTDIKYQKSIEYLQRALKSIPLGSQTFSKSMTQFPYGVSPYYITKGKGSHVWDIDGNEYIDFVNGLLAISLGYQDADVDRAVLEQMQQGVIFSLSHPVEAELAEKIIELVPCAEMVRFGKNGSDATSGAIRAARAYTGKDHVIVCGYHGWQDWYIGSTTKNLGVPKSTQALTHKFSYNDLDSLQQVFKEYSGQVAAVIMEPMNTTFPKTGFLEGVKDITHKHGALLIFDEMITGFRFARGGAQEYFNVTPDLATFGKGVANGYPLSIVAGRKDIMQLFDEIFFSFTFGGETLSIAAALAVLNKMEKDPVIETLASSGEYLLKGVKKLLQKHNLQDVLDTCGHPAWSFLVFKDVGQYTLWNIKTLWMQEMLKRGILSFGTHNISYAHTKQDIDKLLQVYDEVLAILKNAITKNKLAEYLNCETLKPLFKVR